MLTVNSGVAVVLGSVVGIRKQRAVGNNMILEQSLEILLAQAAEEKAIDLGAQFGEGAVGGCKQSPSGLRGVRAKEIHQAGLHQSQIQRAEQRRHNIDGVHCREWQEKDLIESMDYAVCGELDCQNPRNRSKKEKGDFSYNVRFDNMRMKVQRQTPESNLSTDPLRVGTVVLLLQKRRDRLGGEEGASSVQPWGHMIFKPFQDEFLGRLGVMLELLERCIDRDKDGVVGLGAVEMIDNLVELPDDLGKDAGVFILGDELVDGMVWLVT